MLGDVEADVFLFFRDTKPNRHVEKFQERVASATSDDHGDQDAERLDAELTETAAIEEAGRSDARNLDESW